MKQIVKKYWENQHNVLGIVNSFIAANNIKEIISFQDTCRVVNLHDYDSYWQELDGGITLVYTIDVPDMYPKGS